MDKNIGKGMFGRKRGKKIRMIFYIILTIIILVVVPLIINPIRRTDAALRRHLLNITPIGTSMEEVIRIADENNRWTIRVVDENLGVVLGARDTFPIRIDLGSIREQDHRVIGKQSVQVNFGYYHTIMRIYVSAFFAFDENGELVDIFILRDYDLI